MAINLQEFEQHELYLNRLASGGINAYVSPSLEDSYKAIRRILQDAEQITSLKQRNEIMSHIRKAIFDNDGWSVMTIESLDPMAVYEAQWQAQWIGAQLAEEITTPQEQRILSFVNNALLTLTSGQRVNAGTWAEFYNQNLNSRTRAVNNIVKSGYAQGQTINQMSRSIRTLFQGVLKREAESLARTGYQHYAQSAGDAMINANRDVLDEYYYVVTFDNRTTNICISISTKNEIGNRFKVGDKKAPIPPLHFGCRTRRIAVPKGSELSGTKAALDAKASGKQAFEDRKSRLRTATQVRYRGKKDQNIFKPTQIDANISYDAWLRSQPDYYIRDTLGATRFKLFKEQGLTIKDFTGLNGRPLTLEQILARHPLDG